MSQHTIQSETTANISASTKSTDTCSYILQNPSAYMVLVKFQLLRWFLYLVTFSEAKKFHWNYQQMRDGNWGRNCLSKGKKNKVKTLPTPLNKLQTFKTILLLACKIELVAQCIEQFLSFQCHLQDNLEVNNFLIFQFCFSSSSVMANDPGSKNTTAAKIFHVLYLSRWLFCQ